MCCRCGRQAFKYWGELEQLQKRYSQFAKNDLYLMLEWFHAHSIDGTMTQADFLEAMGFTSRAGYLFQRMFNVMDQDGNGQVGTASP
ncbi:MAG: hypothetical protein P4M11_12985 [Candidatus Pacebacteria bacterium]|nr:hypothetical protein [Candidatus Paceibacterota bacterium]